MMTSAQSQGVMSLSGARALISAMGDDVNFKTLTYAACYAQLQALLSKV